MNKQVKTVEDYLVNIPDNHKQAINSLREVISKNLPKGFQEGIQYGMIGYFVPLEIYPTGYHCKKNEPLPFLSLASQKNSVNLYHMGLYANQELINWFIETYPMHSNRKLDMGKSCIRFKYLDDIPFALIGELCSKISVKEWIALYEATFKK